jgi:hypothetical protein
MIEENFRLTSFQPRSRRPGNSCRGSPYELGTNPLLDEAYAEGLKIEHGTDVWFRPASPARLQTDQEFRQGLIECKRRAGCDGRLLEVERCWELDCSTGEAPMACRILHKGFPSKDLLEHIVMGKCFIAGRGLVGRPARSFSFALDERNRRGGTSFVFSRLRHSL